MNKIILFFIVTLFIGCTNYQPIIPKGYKGGVSTISDTFTQVGRGEVQIFYVESINGNPVHNALDVTYQISHNKGMTIYPSGSIRDIPSEPLKITIVGQNYHAAPLGQWLDSKNLHTIKETLSFHPKSEIDYLVKGALKNNYHAIWIEDIFGKIISNITTYDNGKTQYISSNKLKNYSAPVTEEQTFLNIQGGESSEIIIKKLGPPDSMEQLKASLFRPLHQTTYAYNDLGEIYFSRIFNNLFVKKIIPNRENNNITLEDQLLSNNPIFLRELGIDYYKLSDISESELDQIANKIWSLKDSRDPYMIDALSWFCKVLGNSNNSKYRKTLESLASQDIHRKLKKYARSSLENLPSN